MFVSDWDLNGSVTQTGQAKYATESSVDSEIADQTKPVESLTNI